MSGEEGPGELAALRRRVYGADADLAGDPVAVAKLAELERAGRAGAAEDDRHGGDGARADPDVTAPAAGDRDGPSGVNAATRWDDVSEPAESGHSTSGSAFEDAYRPRPSARPGVVDPAAGSEDLAPRAARSRTPEREEPAPDAERTRPRWFSPALVGTSAVTAVIVMLVAGAAGWGGGFLAGWARAASPADGMELVTVLEEVELAEEVEITDDVRDSLGSMLTTMSRTDVETGETTEYRSTYFGRLGEDVHVVVPPSTWGNTDTTGDSICLEIMQVEEADGESMSWHGASACGSRRSGVTADVYATAEDAEQFGPGIALDEFAPGTLLRFIYDDQTKTVAVWSLAPVDEDDPGA